MLFTLSFTVWSALWYIWYNRAHDCVWPVCVCVVRLKGVLEQMDRGVVDLQELRRNLELAAAMLDAVYTDETK